MKKVFDAKNGLEAHMIVNFLEENGIKALVKGEQDTLLQPSVWVEDSNDYDSAIKILNELEHSKMAVEQPAATPGKKKNRFWSGLLVGIAAGFLLCYVFLIRDQSLLGKTETKWDTNGDGKIDAWRETRPDGFVVDSYDENSDGKPDAWVYFKNSRRIKTLTDLDFDGKPDSSTFFNEQGKIAHMEYDEDFDGKTDLWVYYRDGYIIGDASDIDRDGTKDEWGKYEKSRIVERTWSYKNDNVIDKKAIYKNGRKIEEQYDVNRDGKFDQRVILDEFERAIKKENM
jgi:hypothetical protein